MKRKDFLKWAAGAAGALSLPFKAPGPGLDGLQAAAGSGGEEAFWKLVRDQFLLDPEWTYLNFGGLGSCPLPVLSRLLEYTQEEERAPSAGHDAKRWDQVKEKLAVLLGKACRKEDLGLIDGATEGISLIVRGLPLKAGDEVITTTHEHVALCTALLDRRTRDGIVIRTFDPDIRSGAGNVDRIRALINSRTRLIFISHVSCTTGQVFPVAEISRLARDKGLWFALDGAQGPVCVPFDIVECGVDFYVTSTHKWLMGPKRTGFIYVRREMLDALRPLAMGAGSSASYDIFKQELALRPDAGRFEFGTQNDALFYALGAAVDFCRTIGLERIWRHNHALAERFFAGLKEIPGTEILSPEEEAFRSAMIGFRMKKFDFRKINEHLSGDRIRARVVGENGVNCVRVSFHICNHEGEVEKILGSLKRLAAAAV